MTEDARQRDKLVGLFVLGVALFNPPLLLLFSGKTLFGWPLLYVYLFCVWAILIGFVAVVVERRSRRRETQPAED
jgi:peptidoglycan/LPS O-acetylase OafA/YrhL